MHSQGKLYSFLVNIFQKDAGQHIDFKVGDKSNWKYQVIFVVSKTKKVRI